jgi:hypothetical protein
MNLTAAIVLTASLALHPADQGADLELCIANTTQGLVTDLDIDLQVRECAALVGYQGDLEAYLP